MASLGLCVFFYSDRKISQVCQRHKPSVQRENLFIFFLLQMFFFETFSDFEQRNLEFYQKSTSMVVTTTFYGSGGTLRSNISKQVLKHINFFGSLVKFPRQHRKIIFRVDKAAKNVWRKKLRNFFFQEKKTYYFNFFKILREIFLPLAKNYRHGCQNCNLSIFRKFWGKLVFF